jgi:hypothetical protein
MTAKPILKIVNSNMIRIENPSKLLRYGDIYIHAPKEGYVLFPFGEKVVRR